MSVVILLIVNHTNPVALTCKNCMVGWKGMLTGNFFRLLVLFLCIMKMILAPFMKEVLLLIIVRHMIGLGHNIIAPRFPNFLQGLPLQKPLPTQSLTLSPQGLPSHRHGRRGPHSKNHNRKGRENAALVTLMALTALSKNTTWSKIFGTKFTIHSIHLYAVTACSVPATAKLPVLPQVRCPEAVTRRQGPWTYDALELEILMNGLIASLTFLTINSTQPCSGIAKMLLVCTFREVTKVRLAAFFVSCKCRDPTQVGNGEGFDPTPPPSARDDIVLPIIRSGNSTTTQSSSDRAAPPADSWYSQIGVLNHAPESPFWYNRSIDSDGILQDSIDRNHRFVDEALPSLTPESQQVPTPLRWRWYRCPIAGDEDDEDTQTSRRTLENIFDEVHGENAYIIISPIRRSTTSDSLQGGGNDDFQPSKADISKLVQKLKCVQHGFQPKQIRMLLVSDHKFWRKIERTTDSKQLQDCVKAAAQRMGLTLPNPSNTNGKELQQNKRSPNNALPATSSQQVQKEEAPARGWQDKGKGKGNTPQQFKAKGKGKDKGKGKGKGKENPEIHLPAPNSSIPTQNGKAKGKGKHDLPPRSFQLAPEGWNVLPLPEFSSTQGGIYMCENMEQAKRIAELGAGKPFPIGILSPYPLDIGVKKPEVLHVEVIKQTGGVNHKVTMQAFLHQITHSEAVYRKTAPVVNIQKPVQAKSSVCYLTFTDEGAGVQTKLELQQKRIPAAKVWIQSLTQQCRGLEALDVWNLQELSFDGDHRSYQISVRIPSEQVENFLAISGPGKIQVNVPGSLRNNLQHIWLKVEGKPMNEDQVRKVLEAQTSIHLGAFCIRGTWAIRTLAKNFDQLKNRLGRNEEPAYFISNVSPEMEHEHMIELLKQLKWTATIQKGDRRWKGAGYTWLVRSAEEPSIWQFPMHFGYERRTLHIQASRKPKIAQPAPIPDLGAVEFPTWGAQCRAGRQNFRNSVQQQPRFAEIVSTPHRKRPKTDDSMEVQSSFTDDEQLPDCEALRLKMQLEDMAKQNAEQQKNIQQLMAQITDLTVQIQNLVNSGMQGGAMPSQTTVEKQDAT